MFLITLGTSHLGFRQNIFMQEPMRNFVSNGKSTKGGICMCLIHISHTYGFKSTTMSLIMGISVLISKITMTTVYDRVNLVGNILSSWNKGLVWTE